MSELVGGRNTGEIIINVAVIISMESKRISARDVANSSWKRLKPPLQANGASWEGGGGSEDSGGGFLCKKKKKILTIQHSSRQAGASVQVMWVLYHPPFSSLTAAIAKMVCCVFLHFFSASVAGFFSFFRMFNLQRITAAQMSLFFSMKMGRNAVSPQTPDQTQ